MFVLAAQAAAITPTTDRPAYVPNQLVIRTTPNISSADLNAALNKLGAKLIRPISVADTYLVELLPTRGVTVESAVTRSSTIPGIVYATPNYRVYPCAVPNDAMWNQLWGMRMINMPSAWDIEKGKDTVIVAVLDTGVSPTHPDLQGRLLPGRDTAEDDNDPAPSPADPESGHGTHVAGIIAAQGNNSIGVVGVCWNGVKILPVKVFHDNGDGDFVAVVEGLEYAKQQGAQVVNMSLGGPYGPEWLHDKIRELYSAGIILVAAAGNSSGPVEYPAAWDECVAVSALNTHEQITYYSCYGPEIDIAAPGGEDFEDGPGSIWSTFWSAATGDAYKGWQGTSMAAPHVAGAAALLLSAGVPPNRVVGRLYRAARPPKGAVLDPRLYGHGVLDVYQALRTSAEVDIVSPSDGQVLDTTTPLIKITTYLVRRETIKIYMDYADDNKDGVPDDLTKNIVFDGATADWMSDRIQYDVTTGTLVLKWPITAAQAALAPGTHKMCVMGTPSEAADPTPVKDWMVFFIQPHVVPAGLHLFSIPYPLPTGTTPYELFGSTNFRLARYVPTYNTYAKINYPGEIDNPDAWPANPGVHPEGATADTPPAGLGFWLYLTSNTPIVVDGMTDKSRAYVITLTRGATGWNMIGNPFPFPVPWESVKVRYRGKTLTLRDAITAEWIRPALYRYTTSGFTFQTPPEAVLIPWEGHWVRILPGKPDRPNDTMELLVPPIESGSIVETPRSRAVASGSDWSLRLMARAGNAVDSYNLVGINSRAAEGFDPLDVEKPPMMSDYVQLSFVHSDWGANSGRYATDFRSSVGSGKVWEFEVTTDMPSKDVTITWPDIAEVPKKYTLVLEDVDGGSQTYMRTRSAYTYNSGATPGTRHFRLRVQPADAGPMLLTNVAVSQTKGSALSISYTVSRDARVEVRLRDSLNKMVRSLGGNTTRAAGINSVYWDRRFDDGRYAPSGLYLAEIIATATDGEVAKTIRPILVR